MGIRSRASHPDNTFAGPRLTRRGALALAGAAALAAPGVLRAAGSDHRHALAMHGEPALPPDFARFPFVNPDAPRGGRVIFGQQGTFDSLNPLVVRGVAPDLVPRFVLQSLLYRSPDEPFTGYGLLARTVETDEARSFVAFGIDPRARFSDGKPVTAADVVFTYEMLRRHGKPFHRSSLGRVDRVETPDALTVRFVFGPNADRELPLILGAMPIIAKHATNAETFPETSFTPLLGSGPYLVSEVKPGESITLTRRTDFWAEGLPVVRGLHNLQTIRNDYYRDSNALFEAFKAGLSDFRVETDPTRWSTGYDIPAVRDGRIERRNIAFASPKGLSAFVFNTRRPMFQDIRVREALALMFDFEWANRNLFFGVYTRSNSLFAGSELAASGLPADARERALLARLNARLPEAVMNGDTGPPASDGSGRDREMARRAVDLLAAAGYGMADGAMTNRASGAPLAFEITVNSRPQERLALNYAKSLQRIGVTARVRLIDDVQYWRRLAAFDMDMVQWVWPVSASPGNEQANRWGSAAAGRQGSLNYAGAREPAIDGAIQAMLTARAREDYVAAARLLDRLVMAGHYAVPLFYIPDTWVAVRRGVRLPDPGPRFSLSIETLWVDPAAAHDRASQ
jgi:peptide/nickel transport system substrate-binding protein